ncbi:unnamed protein product, partial [Trichogramma brassicae]
MDSTMSDEGQSGQPEICKCYIPDQSGLNQDEARAESPPTSATDGTADSAARMVEDLAWQAETDEWWEAQLRAPQPEPQALTGESTGVEDLIAWLTTGSTPEWPILSQSPTTTPVAEIATTETDAHENRPTGPGETAAEEAIHARREKACADMPSEIAKLEEEARGCRANARRLIQERKEAVEEVRKLQTEEGALRSSLQRLAKQRAELEGSLMTKASQIDLVIRRTNYLDGEAASARRYLAEQAQLGVP